MDITEAARRSGLRSSTLRYYEEKGLIKSIGRQGLRRVFDPDVLDRLVLIALGQAAGFSLDEIGAMLGPSRRQDAPAQLDLDRSLRIDRDAITAKADEIDHKIAELTAMRDALRHAAVCPAPNHLECGKFRRLMRAAATGAIGRKRNRILKKF